MNSILLRKLLREYGALGYLVTGCYLVGYWLFRFKRRQTAVVLAIIAATCAGLCLNFYISAGRTVHSNHSQPRNANGVNARFYTITDLGVRPGYDYSFGQYINRWGDAVGVISDKEFDNIRGFLHTSYGMVEVPRRGGNFNISGVNYKNQIICTSCATNSRVYSFIWDDNKTTEIGTLGGTYCIAKGINDKGQVVGVADSPHQGDAAFLWENGYIEDISWRCPGLRNAATAINNNGDIVGTYTYDGIGTYAFLLNDVRGRDLPTLGGKYTFPAALSTKAAVGYGTLKNDNEIVHGFITNFSEIQDIGTFGGDNSYALGVNDSGVVVGMAQTAQGHLHAALWENGKLIDLNTLIPSGAGWELFAAAGINEEGQIVGTGYIGNTIHAFILKPKVTLKN